jgi:hypothetical protein
VIFARLYAKMSYIDTLERTREPLQGDKASDISVVPYD